VQPVKLAPDSSVKSLTNHEFHRYPHEKQQGASLSLGQYEKLSNATNDMRHISKQLQQHLGSGTGFGLNLVDKMSSVFVHSRYKVECPPHLSVESYFSSNLLLAILCFIPRTEKLSLSRIDHKVFKYYLKWSLTRRLPVARRRLAEIVLALSKRGALVVRKKL